MLSSSSHDKLASSYLASGVETFWRGTGAISWLARSASGGDKLVLRHDHGVEIRERSIKLIFHFLSVFADNLDAKNCS